MKKTITPLYVRVMVFLLVSIVFSSLIGVRIISNHILYRYHFDVYGPLGKVCAFAALAFFLLIRDEDTSKSLQDWKRQNLFWTLGAFATFVVAWLCAGWLIKSDGNVWLAVVTHFLMVGSIVLVVVGVFGLKTIGIFATRYKRQLLYSVAAGAGFFVLLTAIYGSWTVMASSALHATKWLLSATGIHAEIMPPRTLLLSKFGITVEKTCSGIESLALFSGLYALVGVVDWQKLNLKRYFYVFPAALILLFGLNILRIYGLVLGGYFINPHIAFSLFHTYAGMLFFIIYSGIFWAIAYKWMLKRRA